MGSVYRRKSKLWIAYRDAAGARIWKPTTYVPGEEALAERALDLIERQVEAEKATGIPSGELTVKAYGERWMKGRPAQGIATADDEARRLRLHAWPLIGGVALKDLRPHHIRDMVRALRVKNSARGTLLAPRTVRHVYGTLHSMLQEAVVDELLMANPCVLKRGELPGKIDKDPMWRQGAIFTRDEVEMLISDPRIPEHRRLMTALMVLGGLRPGEGAALRFRHYDQNQSPLGRLSVVASWDPRLKTDTSTKTENPRSVPVHPVLAELLASWIRGGFERRHGRPPRPDDLITPNRDGEHRDPRRSLKSFHLDLKTLGLRKRRQHDLRRTFTTLAQADGAPKNILHWITHGPTGDITDLYTSFPWEVLCREVSKLNISLKEGQALKVVQAVAVGAKCDTDCDTRSLDRKKPPSLVDLEASFPARSRGFEPLTFGVTGRRSNQLN